jgi:hypothetical protein
MITSKPQNVRLIHMPGVMYRQGYLDYPQVTPAVNDTFGGISPSDQQYSNISGEDLEQKIKDWGLFAAFVFLDQEYNAFKAKNNTAEMANVLHVYSNINDKVFTAYNGTKYDRPNNPGLLSKPGAPYPGVPSFTELGKVLKTASTWRESNPANLMKLLTDLSTKAANENNTGLVEELKKVYEVASGYKVPKTFGQKALQLVKTGSLAPVRVAFLGLLRLNVFGMASDLMPCQAEWKKRLANQSYDSNLSNRYINVRNLWYKYGGARGDFDDVVAAGSKMKALLGVDGQEPDKLNAVGEVAAMIASATPLIVAVINMVGKKPSGMDAATEAKLKSEAANNPLADPNNLPEPGIPVWVWWVGGSTVLLLGGIFAYLKYKGK